MRLSLSPSPHGATTYAIVTLLHPQGATVGAVRQVFDWLRQEIRNHGRDLGFTGSSDDAIQYACELQAHLLHIQPPEGYVVGGVGFRRCFNALMLSTAQPHCYKLWVPLH